MSRSFSTSSFRAQRPAGTLAGPRSPRPLRQVPARLALVAVALSAPLLLGGCSAQWASMSPAMATTHKTTPSHRAGTGHDMAVVSDSTPLGGASSTSAQDSLRSGDLDRGSLVHQLALGNHLLVIHYWSDSKLATEAGGDIVHLSAALQGADRKHTVKVTRFTAAAGTTTAAQDSTVQLADDRGEFVLTPPYSYTTALALPITARTRTTGLAPGTQTLSIRFDLLIETDPGSGTYFRQSVLDNVVLTRGSEGATK